jgi:hypothetical protein
VGSGDVHFMYFISNEALQMSVLVRNIAKNILLYKVFVFQQGVIEKT